MLNPELFNVFGKDSHEFFNRLCVRCGEILLVDAYAVTVPTFTVGKVKMPRYLEIRTTDDDLVTKIHKECESISYELEERFGSRPGYVICICRDPKLDPMESIKIICSEDKEKLDVASSLQKAVGKMCEEG